MHFFKTPFPIGKIVQERIKMFLEPVFESKMVDESYEFKLRRSAHLALKTIYK
jgi:retron-type reverse transcriptase